jgi:hypothetical protein
MKSKRVAGAVAVVLLAWLGLTFGPCVLAQEGDVELQNGEAVSGRLESNSMYGAWAFYYLTIDPENPQPELTITVTPDAQSCAATDVDLLVRQGGQHPDFLNAEYRSLHAGSGVERVVIPNLCGYFVLCGE